VGVNLNTRREDFPDELRGIATSLYIASGAEQDRLGFACDLLERLEQGIDGLRSGGFEPVLDCWRRYFRMEGARIRVGGPGVREEFEGTVKGIDVDGALVLDVLRDGRTRRERVLAGDVTLLRPEV
jgi:BirA family biotin operon repressor/biotin-[acetyl-CoA-carboxylase] ligase